MLVVEDLCCGYATKEIVHQASFTVDKGEFVCVIGANGCGKTTLFKSVLGLLESFSGTVNMDGRDVLKMDDLERSKLFAYIPQAHSSPFPFSTADVVLMGRTPYMGTMSQLTDEDREIAWNALCAMGIEHLADFAYTELSGGQQQMILIARAIAQQPELIIMDEPTANLDFGNQQIVLSHMKDLVSGGTSVLMVTHDPLHAFICASRVIVMQKGKITGTGLPKDVMTKECLESVYATDVDVIEVTRENDTKIMVCVPSH